MALKNSDLHMQLLTNVAYTSSSLFIPVYAQEMGANDVQIGSIVAAYSLALFLSSYTLGRLSDIYGRKSILVTSLFFASLLAFLQLLARTPELLLIIRFLLGICAGSSTSLIAYAIDLKRDLGNFTSFASLGSAIGQGISGLSLLFFPFGAAGIELLPVFSLSGVLLFVAFILSTLTYYPEHRTISVSFFPRDVFSKGKAAYVSLAMRHLGATAIWALFPVFCYELTPSSLSPGYRLALVSLLYVVNSVVQALTMRFLTSKINAHRLVLLGISLSSLTFLSFTFAYNYLELLITQFLLGVSWAFMYVGGLRYVVEGSAEKGASAGLLSSSMSLSGIFGPILGGSISGFVVLEGFGQRAGFTSVMYFASALSAVAAVIFSSLSGNKADSIP
jgi:MFS family permease